MHESAVLVSLLFQKSAVLVSLLLHESAVLVSLLLHESAVLLTWVGCSTFSIVPLKWHEKILQTTALNLCILLAIHGDRNQATINGVLAMAKIKWKNYISVLV